MSKKGILVDVGFKADIQEFIDNINREFKRIDFEEIIGLSDAFEKEEKEVRKKLKELSSAINETIGGKTGDEPLRMMKGLQESVEILAKNMKAMFDAMPSDMADKYAKNMSEINSSVNDLAGVCKNAKDAVEALNKVSGTSIRFVDTDEIKRQRTVIEKEYKEIKNLIKGIEKSDIGQINKNGKEKFSQKDFNILVDLIGQYYEKAEIAQESYYNAIESEDQKLIESSTKTYSKLTSILFRYINTYASLGGEMKNVLSFDDFDIPINKIKDMFIDDFEDLRKTLLKESISLSNDYAKISDELLEDVYSKSVAKTDKTTYKVPMDISTSPSELSKKAIRVIEDAQERLVDHPLEVEVHLISNYGNYKNIRGLKYIEDNLKNIEDENIQKEIANIITEMNKRMENALLFNVDVNTTKATTAVRNFVREIRDEIDDLSSTLYIHPNVEIAEEEKNKLQTQINDMIKDNFKIDLSIVSGENTDELAYIDKLKKTFRELKQSVEDVESAFVRQGKTANWIFDAENNYLNRLFQSLYKVHFEVEKTIKAFTHLPDTIPLKFNIEGLSSLSNNDVLDKIKAAQDSVRNAVAYNVGNSIQISDDDKRKILKDIKDIASEIEKIFNPKVANDWSNNFVYQLTEANNKIQDLFNNSLIPANYLNSFFKIDSSDDFLGLLNKTIENLKQIQELSISESFRNAFNSDYIQSFSNRVQDLIDSIVALPERINSSIAEDIDVSPFQKLETAFSNYKSFYDNNNLESEAGANAALAYFNAYKDALASKINKKDLLQFTIGNPDDLFTGNYTNYKKGTEKLDLSGIENEILRYRGILETINQPEIAKTIQSISDAINQLLESGNNSEKTIQFLTQFNKTISSLSGNKSTDKLEKIVSNLETFRNSLQSLDISDSGIISEINNILEKGERLKDLANVLKSTKKQIDAAQSSISGHSKSSSYLNKSEDEIRKAVSSELNSKGLDVLYQKLESTKDGLVKINSLVQDSLGEYKKYTAVVDENGNLQIRVSDNNQAALSKEIKQWQEYVQLMNSVVPPHLGSNGEAFTPDSSNWDQLISKAESFGIKIEDIRKIIRNVDREGYESFQIFTDLSRITVGMDSDNVLFQKDTVFDEIETLEELKKEILSINSTLKSAFNGSDVGSYKITESLNSIANTIKYINQINKNGSVINLSGLDELISSLNKDIGNFSIEKITNSFSKKSRTKELIDQLELLKSKYQEISEINLINSKDVDVDILKVIHYVESVRDLFSKINLEDNILADTKAIEKELTKLEKDIHDHSGMPKDLMTKYKALSEAMRKSMDLGMVRSEFKEFSTEVAKLHEELIATGKTGKSLFDIFKNDIIKKSVGTLAQFFSLYDIIGYARQAFYISKEYNSALTEMRKVTDASIDSLKKYQDASFDVADQVGTTSEQIQKSTADFLRIGESFAEAAQSAKDANILFNVSEFKSIEEATDSLISMSQAYKELSKEEINDILNVIGNNFAISTDGLATALQTSASALKTAGNDLYSASALVASANTIIQNPDSVGAGLRTIALRLTGTSSAKKELEALGEDTEGLIETQSKLRDIIIQATSVASNQFKGFDILDENGNYKNTYEIMLGISEVYKEIVETDKKFGNNNVNLLLETVAGKNRSNIAASIFQNPEILKEAYSMALNDSSGSAMKENEKYLDSLEAKTISFTNALHELALTVADADSLKKLVDYGTQLINVIDSIIDKFGLLETLLVGAGGIAGAKGLGLTKGQSLQAPLHKVA